MTRPAFAALLLAASPAGLVLAASPAAAEVTVIQADRVLAEPGKAPLGPTSIVVDKGRIVALLPGRQAPAGAKVIDLGSRFVLPGLIDSHVHLDSDAGGEAALVESVTSSAGTSALRAQWNGMKTLNAGFTTVRNLGGGSGATLALRDAIAAGWTQGPRAALAKPIAWVRLLFGRAYCLGALAVTSSIQPSVSTCGSSFTAGGAASGTRLGSSRPGSGWAAPSAPNSPPGASP